MTLRPFLSSERIHFHDDAFRRYIKYSPPTFDVFHQIFCFWLIGLYRSALSVSYFLSISFFSRHLIFPSMQLMTRSARIDCDCRNVSPKRGFPVAFHTRIKSHSSHEHATVCMYAAPSPSDTLWRRRLLAGCGHCSSRPLKSCRNPSDAFYGPSLSPVIVLKLLLFSVLFFCFTIFPPFLQIPRPPLLYPDDGYELKMARPPRAHPLC